LTDNDLSVAIRLVGRSRRLAAAAVRVCNASLLIDN